jgi:hypothetical protein
MMRVVMVRELSVTLVLLCVPVSRAGAQSSPEEAVRAFFAAGSGTAGSQPLDRLPALFLPTGQLLTIQVTDTATRVIARTPTEYVEGARSYLATTDQFEGPVRLWVEHYGNLGNVFCAFEARRTPDGDAFYRGVASFQLLRDGERWRIVTAFWQGERPGAPLPPRYRP